MTYEDVKRIRENTEPERCENRELAMLIDRAIERQIPEKPADKMNNSYICHCGTVINTHMTYCDKCGQKIDWSESNDI